MFSLTAANIPAAASSSLSTSAYADFQTLSALGSVTNGVFTLSAAGLAAKASVVLSPTHQSFLALGASGTVQYSSYRFNSSGISTYAQSGIAAGNQNFQTLVSNGNIVNGALVLTASGIANLRSAAAAASASSIRAIRMCRPTPMRSIRCRSMRRRTPSTRSYLQKVTTDASAVYLSYVQRIADYYAEHNFVLDPTRFWVFEQMILGPDYANYQLPKANGTATLGTYPRGCLSGGSFTLNPQAAATVAPVVRQSADCTSYQALLAKGVVQNGSFVLASSNVYQAFQQLAANGTIQNSAFAFTNAGIQSNAQSILGSAFQQLTGYGAVQGNTFVLGSNGVAY